MIRAILIDDEPNAVGLLALPPDTALSAGDCGGVLYQ